jgi:hypothetical protein
VKECSGKIRGTFQPFVTHSPEESTMTVESESNGATRASSTAGRPDHHHLPRQAGAEDGANTGLRDRHAVVQREKEQYGGIKWGSAFFGWLTATGSAVILTAVLAGVGTAVGVSTDTSVADATEQATQKPGTIGVAGGIALLVVLLVAYYCGGYVAGRMARFNGIKQGVAVWIWAMVIAVLVAVAAAVLGSKFDLLAHLDGIPRIPTSSGEATTGAIIGIVIAVLAALIGAILGGLAGMRFHRKVDKAGLGG